MNASMADSSDASMTARAASSSLLPVIVRGTLLAGGLSLLTACSGSDPGDLGSARVQQSSPLVNNAAYPNVSENVAYPSAAPKSPAEVQAIRDNMMSLAAGQDSVARQQPSSVVQDLQSLAKKNRKIVEDDIAEAAANGN
jgi:hypothetical protein